MSRRKERAWEELLSRHRMLAQEEEDFWESVAQDLGISVDDFQSPGPGYYDDGSMELDVPGLASAARDFFFDRGEGAPPPLVMVTLKCQRCDRRLDTWRVRSNRWIAPEPGSGEGWKLDDLRITSEAWAKEIGDSVSELIRKSQGRPLTRECACGRQSIQFSMKRILETLHGLLPENPRWSPGGDDAHIVWPASRYVTIRG